MGDAAALDGVSRRSFLRDTTVTTGVAAGALALGTTPAVARTAPTSKRRVAILGGGVAGLTAAHELIERGFDVTVYERKALGGKARSIPVPNTGTGGRLPLPGEHGFRFFPSFYRNLPDTMRRIPHGKGNVRDNLVATPEFRFSRANGREDLVVPAAPAPPSVITPESVLRFMVAVFQQGTKLPPQEVAYFARKAFVFMTSCDERRVGQWENTSWWKVIAAEKMSKEYRQLLGKSVTRLLVAAKAEVASTNTIGTIGEAFITNLLGKGRDGEIDRLLNGSTNETWIDPMAAYLRSRGVQFNVGWTAERLTYRGGSITAATVRDPAGRPHEVDADWFILAVPLDRARPLLNRDILAADPSLGRLRNLKTDWMNGIQFYLRKRTPIVKGHVAYADSPWSLTSISQAQFWKKDFAKSYGDGIVQDCLSVDISGWSEPGILYGKPASKCTREQIAKETWAQLKASLNDSGQKILTDDLLHSWFLDPGIVTRDGAPTTNDEPLLVNTIGSWNNRPTANTKVPNLFLAADYVKVNVNLATMEGANEAGRLAVNALLDAADSSKPHAHLHTLYQLPAMEPWKRLDTQRYKSGQANIFDTDSPMHP